MIERHPLPLVREALVRQAAVALMGPRQAGKTTLPLTLSEEIPALFIDYLLDFSKKKTIFKVLMKINYGDKQHMK